jgi:hypothetical protein
MIVMATIADGADGVSSLNRRGDGGKTKADSLGNDKQKGEGNDKQKDDENDKQESEEEGETEEPVFGSPSSCRIPLDSSP